MRNEFSGSADGPVVQAGSIGEVNLNVPHDAEQAAFQARLRERTERAWAAEDAERRRRQAVAAQNAKSRRRFLYVCWIVLTVSVTAGVLWARDENGVWMATLPACAAGIGILFKAYD